MNPPHRTHRPDNNRDEIVKALEARGWHVFKVNDVGEKGFPDLIIAKQHDEGWWSPLIVEIKNGNKKYTPDQIKFHEKYAGLPITVRSVEDVERLF